MIDEQQLLDWLARETRDATSMQRKVAYRKLMSLIEAGEFQTVNWVCTNCQQKFVQRDDAIDHFLTNRHPYTRTFPGFAQFQDQDRKLYWDDPAEYHTDEA